MVDTPKPSKWHLIKNTIYDGWSWKNRLPEHLFWSIAETFLVLILSNVPFYFLTLQYVTDTAGASITFATALHVIQQNVRPGEVLAYIATILAASIVYFIIRPKIARLHPITFTVCTIAPIAVLFFATPIYMADRYKKAANEEFMTNYSLFLFFTALALWTYSTFMQRRIEAARPPVSLPDGAQEIIRRLGGGE